MSVYLSVQGHKMEYVRISLIRKNVPEYKQLGCLFQRMVSINFLEYMFLCVF